VFYPIQMAAVAALTSHYTVLKEQVKEYEKRRDTLLSGLKMGGWKVSKSPATMFVWAKVPTGWTSRQFAFELIEKAGVAVVPGDAFGGQGEGYVRMAIVQPSEKLAQAAERIQTFLKQNEPSR
jgi:LL-diaminopimelate aminotransferase